MTEFLLYVALAVFVLALAVILACQRRSPASIEVENQWAPGSGLLDCAVLQIVERIFDPADYRWLQDEIKFPQLAATLARKRKEMALRWLRGLRISFNELVRSPRPDNAVGRDDDPSDWALLLLTLRFQLLLGYAVLVVRLFGPYHRLVPSFGWLRVVSGVEFRKEPQGIPEPGA